MIDYFESCMDFSPLFENNCSLYLEKSNFRTKQCENVKTVEFITLCQKKQILYFIEAKRTAPDPNNPENKEEIFKYYQDLFEKMQQSLDMYISKEVGVNIDEDNEFPTCFNESEFSCYKLTFILIVKNSEKRWRDDVREKICKKLHSLRKIWQLEVLVLTGAEAISKGFVASFVCKSDDSNWNGYDNCPRSACIQPKTKAMD